MNANDAQNERGVNNDAESSRDSQGRHDRRRGSGLLRLEGATLRSVLAVLTGRHEYEEDEDSDDLDLHTIPHRRYDELLTNNTFLRNRKLVFRQPYSITTKHNVLTYLHFRLGVVDGMRMHDQADDGDSSNSSASSDDEDWVICFSRN